MCDARKTIHPEQGRLTDSRIPNTPPPAGFSKIFVGAAEND